MRMLDVAIFGTGGAAKGFHWHLTHKDAVIQDRDGSWCRPRIVGYLDDNAATHGQTLHGVPVLGGIEWAEEHPGEAVFVGMGFPRTREKVADRLKETGVWFPSFVSPDARVADDCVIGQGVFVSSGVVSTFDCELGDFTLLNLNVTFGHDSVIGAFGNLNPGATVSGQSTIGRCVDFGANSTVVQGISIGDYAVIGAAACVINDIPGNATAVGVPAKVIRIANSQVDSRSEGQATGDNKI